MPEVEELCEYIYVMDKGLIIAEGTPKELALMGVEEKILCMETYIMNTSSMKKYLEYVEVFRAAI
jgi:ABC-2 type transport system ATP-binding protein